MRYNNMNNFMDFSSDKVDIFLILVDKSGSMASEESKVREGLKLYKKSFENFPEVGSIAVSISKFADDFYPKEFVEIKNLSTDYYADGATALHYSIVEGAKLLKTYMQEITEAKGIIPRATFILLSDGEPCCDKRNKDDAKEAVKELNFAGVTTVFVAFGEAISSNYGKEIGFMSTIDVNNRSALVNFLGVELSKSCKEQSRSLKALGENFFSKAVGEQSAEYSSKTAQTLDDDEFFNDI